MGNYGTYNISQVTSKIYFQHFAVTFKQNNRNFANLWQIWPNLQW